MHSDFCAHCHEGLKDGARLTWEVHCRTTHPELVEIAARSDTWDAVGPA